MKPVTVQVKDTEMRGEEKARALYLQIYDQIKN